MKKKTIVFLLIMICILSSVTTVGAAKKYKNFVDIAEQMYEPLDKVVELYGEGKAKEAKAEVDVAYYRIYEKTGFEKTVGAVISGRRVADVEGHFYDAKHFINDEVPVEELKELIDELKEMLMEDAIELMGGVDPNAAKSTNEESVDNTATAAEQKEKSSSLGWKIFLSAFILTIREGLEAILVIVGIIAYLIKSGNKKLIKPVYLGAFLGIIFSIILAIIFNIVSAGVGQEIFEGFAMFLAVIVLFWVSNWMISKAEVELWDKYISDKVEKSITTGSKFALVFSAFLAVGREGAELIIFFQGLGANEAASPIYLWGGLGLALVTLVIIYILLRYFSVRLPLKPFFYGTSILMFLLCISFLGKGVYELQEAGLISQRTVVPWMNGISNQWLGIYDRYESIIPQLILIGIGIISFIIHMTRAKKLKKTLEMEKIEKN